MADFLLRFPFCRTARRRRRPHREAVRSQLKQTQRYGNERNGNKCFSQERARVYSSPETLGIWETLHADCFPSTGIDEETCTDGFCHWTPEGFVGLGLIPRSTSRVSTFAETHPSSFWQRGSRPESCDPRLRLNSLSGSAPAVAETRTGAGRG